MEENTIKTITPQPCPNCSNMIFIESVITAPAVASVLSVADVASAKEDARNRLSGLNLTPTKNLEVLAYLEKEETIFGPDDVDLILEQFQS